MSSKSRRLSIKLVVLGLVAIGAWISTNLTVATTKSLEKRVFWQTSEIPTKTGQYGSFIYPSSDYLIKREVNGKVFTKRVGCFEGDYLNFVDGAFYCNGEYLAKPLVSDRLDDKLPVFRFNGIVPEDMAFMVGDHPYSGDSRYLGFVDINTVKRVIPLW